MDGHEGRRERAAQLATDAGDGQVTRAWRLAEEAHRGVRRASGEAYVTHPLAVAELVAAEGGDADAVCAALLHDVVEDTDVTLERIEAEFGADVARLVDGVTKVRRTEHEARRTDPDDRRNLQHLVTAAAGDLRVLLIKTCDRRHNMRTITHLPPDRQERISRETLAVHVPLAGRLGMADACDEMTENALRVLYADSIADVERMLAERSDRDAEAAAELAAELEENLARDSIAAGAVTWRTKSPTSVFLKMHRSGRRFDEIHDLIAIRIIVETEAECYMALGTVHRTLPPVSGRFVDHIALPKANLYQSLHTTVHAGEDLVAEVQIRTQEMHMRAEHGFAAHWQYKSELYPRSSHRQGNLDAQLRRSIDGAGDTGEVYADLVEELGRDQITVLTPAGDAHHLPVGSTVIDLAYAVHSDVGDHAVGSTVDGRPADLDRELADGDRVRIIVDPSRSSATPALIDAARTGRARRRLRAELRRQKEARDAERGPRA